MTKLVAIAMCDVGANGDAYIISDTATLTNNGETYTIEWAKRIVTPEELHTQYEVNKHTGYLEKVR